jgi:hypothetical protein
MPSVVRGTQGRCVLLRFALFCVVLVLVFVLGVVAGSVWVGSLVWWMVVNMAAIWLVLVLS